MLETGRAQQRINIPYMEGVNSLVSFNIGKKTEFVHAENARSKTVGTIEKREGQTVLGVNSIGKPFVTTANYGLFSFRNDSNQGLYRISVNENPVLSISIVDDMIISESFFQSSSKLYIRTDDTLNVSGVFNNNTNTLATVYYLNSGNQWIPLTGGGTNIPGGVFDYTYAENCVFLVNQNAPNRYINSDGTTVNTSADTGHMFNTPPASRINFYKNRLYLADFTYAGNRYKTTILRSSYPMGIVALLNNDYSTAVSGTTINVTDTKYFYTDAGANTYDVYRGPTLISTITVTAINETSITATWTGTPNFLSSDEVWVAGTYSGKKVFRWINNSSATGRDIKQYDTMKLSGGENDPITMMTNIGNTMIASNRSVMCSWNDYTLENFDLDIGCVSRKGYVKMIGTLYFMHYTGVYATTGSIPTLISNKIEKYITGATRSGKENSAAGKKGRSIFFTLGDVTLYKQDGSINKVLKDVCVEYNLTQQNWYVHTNVKTNEFATFLESVDSDRLELADTSGNHAIKEFLSGTTDDGAAIHFRVDTMKLTSQPNNFEYSCKPNALIAEVERGAAMQVYVNLDNGEEFYPVEGSLVKGLSIVKITNKDGERGKPPTCRLLSISLRDSSPQLCKVSRMIIVFLPTTDEDVNNDA